MITDIGRGGSRTTLTTISSRLDSTALSIAKAAASASKGTLSVARSTGRDPVRPAEAGTRTAGLLARTISLGREVPGGHAPRRPPHLAPPPRHVQHEPDAEDD